MVLDSVASNDVLFSENHAFYCFLLHEGSLTINMQYFIHTFTILLAQQGTEFICP